MSALSPRSGIQVSSVYTTYTHIKGHSPVCVCVCVCVCMCVCVCSQASRSRATLSCNSSYFSFMDSFLFKHQVLFRVDFLSVTLDHRVQCPRVWLGVKIKEILKNHFLFLVYFSLM